MVSSSPVPVDSEERPQASSSPPRPLSRRSAADVPEDVKTDTALPPPLSPSHDAQERPDKFPGIRKKTGRKIEGMSDVVNTLKLLSDAGVFGCVVDINALRYYGAGRITAEWDICVPASQFQEAVQLFTNSDKYEPAKPCPPGYRSVRYLNSFFHLKGVSFYFLLTPSSRYFFDPRPENCETSKGVPYPTMPHFAQSLLALQYGPDLADFVDGMNPDKEWGRENIDFADLQVKGMEFARLMNAELVADGRTASFYTDINFQKQWDNFTTTKESRIEPMKQGRYKTRWRRIKNDTDPRERNRPF